MWVRIGKTLIDVLSEKLDSKGGSIVFWITVKRLSSEKVSTMVNKYLRILCQVTEFLK